MHEYWKLILGFQNHAPLVHAEIVSSSRDYEPLIYSVLLNLLSMDAGGFFFLAKLRELYSAKTDPDRSAEC
jgi:hypothetical protein